MSRSQQKYSEFRLSVGARLIAVIEGTLKISLAEASRSLGYQNATTLYAVKRGKALPDPERLVLAAQKWQDSNGQRLDLHWLLTGEGVAFPVSKNSTKGQKNDIIIRLEKLSDIKRQALWTLLDVE